MQSPCSPTLPCIEATGRAHSIFRPTLERPDLARERHAKGHSAPLFRSYADPGVLTDDVIRLYLQPLFVEVDDARLFFPEDRPDALAAPMPEFWNELSIGHGSPGQAQ
jgi:hypothetical protein